MIGAGILAGTYEGTRQDNPDLANSPPSVVALSRSVGDQGRVLNELSRTGKTLLGQLTATESELESAKKQLSATLANFDEQRGAAEQVTEALKRIDARQKQLALQTEELERILEGQQPITRQDLRRSTLQGLISGLAIGFVTSLLASATYNAFVKARPPAG